MFSRRYLCHQKHINILIMSILMNIIIMILAPADTIISITILAPADTIMSITILAPADMNMNIMILALAGTNMSITILAPAGIIYMKKHSLTMQQQAKTHLTMSTY